MSQTSPIDPSYPWTQLELIPTDQFTLKVHATLSARTDRIVCTVELREGDRGTLVGLQTFGGDLCPDSVLEVGLEIARWLTGARDRLMPF